MTDLSPDLAAQRIACKSCKWWTAADDAWFGVCRGAPPQMLPDGSRIARITPGDEYCAVYAKRLTPGRKPLPVKPKRPSLTDPEIVKALIDDIWRVYPERDTPHQFIPARAAINALLDEGVPPRTLFDAVMQYAQHCRKTNTEGKYVKAIHNFFADNFWQSYTELRVNGLTRDEWAKSGQDMTLFDQSTDDTERPF